MTFPDIAQLINTYQLAGAAQKLDEIIQNDATNSEALYLSALVLYKQDQFEAAADRVQMALKIDDTDARFYELLGQALGLKAQQAGPVKGALILPKIKAAFHKALDLDVHNLGAKEGLFVFLLFTPSIAGGDEKKAMKILEEIRAQHPGHADMLTSMVLLKKNQPDQAVESVDHAVAKCPDDTELIVKAARFYLAQNKVEKALDTAGKLLKITKEDPRGYDIKGDCMRMQNKLPEAIESYRQVLHLNPSFYPGRRKLAECLQEAGAQDEAKETYRYILDNHPDTPAAGLAKQALKTLT